LQSFDPYKSLMKQYNRDIKNVNKLKSEYSKPRNETQTPNSSM